MVESTNIQLRGFHNTYDANGDIDGFEFEFRSCYYKGLWLSQIRLGHVWVDGVKYDRNDVIWNFNGMDYTREELFEAYRVYWPVNDTCVVKIKKPGGLAKGYHDIGISFGWVLNYNGDKEKEFDGSGLGNSVMFGDSSKGLIEPQYTRRMLLAR